MPHERLPKSIPIFIVLGVTALTLVSLAVPGKLVYVHKKPAVDVSKIGVESLIPKGGGEAGLEGTIAHAETHKKVEQEIFFTPGGQYTQEDIQKNGTMAPSKKFGDLMAIHDINPEKGTLVCPITNTKANPQFYWWVGGKKYTFCCPPCVEEFVLKAKKSKVPLPSPETFIAK